MAGVGVPLAITITNVGAQNVAFVAACTAALGTPTSNADVAGTWTTAWASVNFGTADRNPNQPLWELARLIGKKPSGFTVTIVG